MVVLGVIGGSSLTNLDPKEEFGPIGLSVTKVTKFNADTAHGKVALKRIELSGDGGVKHSLVFMQRHGHADGGAITPPHKINHKANIRALFDQKVEAIIATSSVGTIVSNFPPGRVGVCNQYIDFTGAVVTYHEDDAKFTSVTTPFDPKLNAALLKTLRKEQKLAANVQLEFVYWLSPGPYYETPAEVTAAERMGAHICGMTCPREAKLCRELDVPYTSLAIASNWAAGRHPGDPSMALCHEEVSEMSARVTGTILKCLCDLLKNGLPGDGAAGSSRASSLPSSPAAKKSRR